MGDMGRKGEKGLKGFLGNKGAEGPTGPPGDKGNRGDIVIGLTSYIYLVPVFCIHIYREIWDLEERKEKMEQLGLWAHL